VPVTQVVSAPRSLDVEQVTKRFYSEFKEQHDAFLARIEGIEAERDAAGTLDPAHRLMFVYFLQKKGFLDGGDQVYLRRKLDASRKEGPDLFYRRFLNFFSSRVSPASG